MKHINIKIYGRVHGVGFRYSSEFKARELNIKGFARNESDGTVYIEVEGKEKDLEKLLKWCKKGSSFSKVEKIDFEYSDNLKNFKDFRIEY